MSTDQTMTEKRVEDLRKLHELLKAAADGWMRAGTNPESRAAIEPQLRQLDALTHALTIVEAFNRSTFDLSPCFDCGEPVVTVPDGMPTFCEACGEKEAARA